MYTAISRTKPSAPMSWLYKQDLLAGRVLDFGCGRGFDTYYFCLEGYDPHWSPKIPDGKFDTIACIYVFNVLTDEQVKHTLEQIKFKLNPGGKAYIAIRRDIKDKAKGRGCIQRNLQLDLPSIKRTTKYEIYEYHLL
jgi:cyclopropane fatty-acyl-phospholipid synthase-like methyltransferase